MKVPASTRTYGQAKANVRTDKHRHPIRAAIESFMLSRLLLIKRLFKNSPLRPEHIVKLRELTKELDAFGNWVGQPLYALSEPEKQHCIDAVFVGRENGMTSAQIVDVLQEAGKRPRGHQVKTRHLALTALETKIVHKRLSWAEITDRLCPSRSREQLRRDIVRLRNLLRRHGLLPDLS